VLAELSAQSGPAAEAAIRAEGGQARWVQTDVSDAAAVARLAQAVLASAGGCDVLVNNAMRCPVAGVAEMSTELWDSVIAVNLRGTFLVTRAFLNAMVARGSGVILNMVSTDAMPGLSAYIASKQGIEGFSQSLALEVGQSGVKVIPFGPGMVDTPGIRGVADDLAPRLGLSREQFLKLSLHAAYDGLMPAEHAGAAAAYLALRLAGEFHGTAVNGYEVLERAGVLASDPVIAAAVNAPAAVAPDEGKNLDDLVETLVRILADSAQEFEKLPVFVRPIARSGFKGKAGMSMDDWQRALVGVHHKTGGLAPAEREAWRGRLEKLAGYYRGVPGETARFTRDAEMLRQTSELCAQRVDVIERLREGLK